MKNKQTQDKENFITKRDATLILGFKNTRSISELINNGYLKTYTFGAGTREVLSKNEVLNLPKKDLPA